MRLVYCFCLASASGVMAYVSLVELFGKSLENFKHGLSAEKKLQLEKSGTVVADCDMHDINDEVEPTALRYATIVFFIGWVVGLLMDKGLHKFMKYRKYAIKQALLPFLPITSTKYSMDISKKEDQDKLAQRRFEIDLLRLIRVGWFTALALTMHNIPEGLLIYTAAQASDEKAAYGIALAIALHNIAAGFAVAMPIYIATRSREKAMLYGKL